MTKTQATPPVLAGGNGKNSKNSITEQKETKQDVLAEQLMQAGKIKYFSEQPGPRQWLIDHFLPKGQVVLLAGLGAEGKTMLCLQWIMQLAAGIDFHSQAQTNAPKDFKALIVSAEDDKIELHSRIRRIAEYYIVKKKLSENILPGIESSITAITDDTAPDWFSALTHATKNGIQPTASYYALKHLVLSHNYKLVVIDALTSTFSGNLSEMTYAQPTLKLCRELTRNGATVILIHHLNKSAMSDIKNFDDLVSKTFGSVGTLNRIRHNLILYKNCLFVSKTNIAKRVAIRVPKNEDYYTLDPSDQHLLEYQYFDGVVKSLSNGNGNTKNKKHHEHSGNSSNDNDPFGDIPQEENLIPSRGRKRRVPNYGL
jgi:RecA-family ATPase